MESPVVGVASAESWGRSARSDRHLVLRSGAFGSDDVLVEALSHRADGVEMTDG